MPRTSPVERISGPKSGSTSGNMLKGNTASFTPKCGMDILFNFMSDRLLPSINCVAIRTIEIPQTFETSGTVLDARGLASRM